MRRIGNTPSSRLGLGLAVIMASSCAPVTGANDEQGQETSTAVMPPGPGAGPVTGAETHGQTVAALGASLRYVTGQDPLDPSFPRTQSETAMANGINAPGTPLPAHVMVAAFNDWNGVTRAGLEQDHIKTGSSYLGYSTSLNTGSTWQYRGVLYPFDNNFPVLRGDPSASSSPTHRNVVVVGALAHSADQLVSVFYQVDYPNVLAVPPGVLPRGVCVFTSGNGGSTFTGYRCVSKGTDQFDGTSLAVGADDTIYVASMNETTNYTEVWSIAPGTGLVTLMPRPFPANTSNGHPQLRFDATTNRLYAATRAGSQLLIAYWSGAGWSAPVVVNPPGTSINTSNVVFGSPAGSVRQGRFFSFDLVDPILIGGASYGGYALRYAFMATMASGGRGLVVGACAADLTGCARVPSWEPFTSSSSVLFDPVVRAYRAGPTQYPQVRLSWLSRDSAAATTFSVVRRSLSLTGTAPPAPLSTTVTTDYAAMNACPHPAKGGGYIGDYNEMVAAPYESRPGYRFARAFSWSPDTCAASPSGYSDDQHVGAVTF